MNHMNENRRRGTKDANKILRHPPSLFASLFIYLLDFSWLHASDSWLCSARSFFAPKRICTSYAYAERTSSFCEITDQFVQWAIIVFAVCCCCCCCSCCYWCWCYGYCSCLVIDYCSMCSHLVFALFFHQFRCVRVLNVLKVKNSFCASECWLCTAVIW